MRIGTALGGFLVAALGLISGGVSATVITFDALEQPGSSTQFLTAVYDEGDYRFTSVDGALGSELLAFQQSSIFYNGSAGLAALGLGLSRRTGYTPTVP